MLLVQIVCNLKPAPFTSPTQPRSQLTTAWLRSSRIWVTLTRKPPPDYGSKGRIEKDPSPPTAAQARCPELYCAWSPVRSSFPCSPHAPLSAQPPAPTQTSSAVAWECSNVMTELHTVSTQDTGSSGNNGQPKGWMQVLPIPDSGITYAGF